MKSPRYLKAVLAFASAIALYAVAVRRYGWLPSYLKVASFTTLNIALNAATTP